MQLIIAFLFSFKITLLETNWTTNQIINKIERLTDLRLISKASHIATVGRDTLKSTKPDSLMILSKRDLLISAVADPVQKLMTPVPFASHESSVTSFKNHEAHSPVSPGPWGSWAH